MRLPSGGKDRDRAPLVTDDSAEGGAQARLGTLERCRRHAEDPRDAVGPKTVASLLQGQDYLGGAGPDPVNASQVDAGKSPEGGSGRLLPARLEGFLLGRIGVGGEEAAEAARDYQRGGAPALVGEQDRRSSWPRSSMNICRRGWPGINLTRCLKDAGATVPLGRHL